jgi:CRP-like cAMP-binding protein
LVLEGWLCRHKITLEGARQIFSLHIAGDIPDLQSLHLKTMDDTLSSVTPSTVAFVQNADLRTPDAAFPRLGDILWRDTLIDAAIFRVRMRAVGLTKETAGNFRSRSRFWEMPWGFQTLL